MQKNEDGEDELLSFRGFLILILLATAVLAPIPPAVWSHPLIGAPFPFLWVGSLLPFIPVYFRLQNVDVGRLKGRFYVTLHAKILSSSIVTDNLLTFLASSNSSIQFIFSFSGGGTTLYFRYTRRSLLPLKPMTIKKELEALFITYNIRLSWERSPEIEGDEFWVHDPLCIPSLDKFVLDIVSVRMPNCTLFSSFSLNSSNAEVSFAIFLPRDNSNGVDAILKSYGTSLSRVPSSSSVSEPEKIWRLIRFQPLADFPLAPAIMSEDSGKTVIGKQLLDGNEFGDVKISSSDLREGGLITGSIGQGKTNLRLHIVRELVQDCVKVIDFDLKGDVCHYLELTENADVFVPGVNFQVNIFSCPPELDKLEYGQMLLTSLLETIAGDELTPPQRYLLERAVTLSVLEDGNPLSFMEKIVQLGEHDRALLDNRQDASALALLTRFSWMHTLLRSVIWTSRSSFDSSQFLSKSIFFDLSSLNQTVPIRYIRLLIELLLVRVMAKFRRMSPSTSSLPKVVISIDEAQVLFPKRSSGVMSKLEQIVTTMRYKGLAVLAAGVNQSLMSDVLLDTGFSATFYSPDSDYKHLLPYECILRKRSSLYSPVHARINQYGGNRIERNFVATTKVLSPFSLTPHFLQLARDIAPYSHLLQLSIGKIQFYLHLLDQLVEMSIIEKIKKCRSFSQLSPYLFTLKDTLLQNAFSLNSQIAVEICAVWVTRNMRKLGSSLQVIRELPKSVSFLANHISSSLKQ